MRLGEPGHTIAGVRAQPSLCHHNQTHGDTLVFIGFMLRSREAQGVHQQPFAGTWTKLPRGATTIFLTIQHAGKCLVWSVPKMQMLQQKCSSFGGAWHHPELRAPLVTAGTEIPRPCQLVHGLTQQRGEGMCPRAHQAAVSEEGKAPWEGSCHPPPKGSGPRGLPRGGYEGTGAGWHRGGKR